MATIVKALVIDDSAVMRKMVMRALNDSKLANFEYIEAGDGQDALDKMTQNDIDIAFVDWNMPNMTGIEFVTQVRKREKSLGDEPLPLIMVTSEKTIGKMQIALDEAGADHFISKPFTVDEIISKLKRFIDKAVLARGKKTRDQILAEQMPAKSGWLGKLFS